MKLLRISSKQFSKKSLKFVNEQQLALRESNFRERIFNPDFGAMLSAKNSCGQGKLDLNLLKDCLITPFWDLATRDSKFMRPVLIGISAELLGVTDRARVELLSGFVECLHNATLIVDDVIDNSTLRRGRPCIHLTHGVDTALTCYGFADHFLIRSLVNKLEIGSAEKRARIYDCVLGALEVLYVGLAWDVEWHKPKKFDRVPSMDNFLLMLELKTSKLINLANEVMGILYDVPEEAMRDLTRAFDCFGVSFQINDDLINIYSEQFARIKGLSDDIIESKLSFPIMCFIENHKNTPGKVQELFDAMNVAGKTEQDIQRVLELITSVDCSQTGAQLARAKMNECHQILENRFPTKVEGLTKMKQLGQYILDNEFLKAKNTSG